MKKFSSVLVVVLMMVGTMAFAQQGPRYRGGDNQPDSQKTSFGCNIPNLTADQQQKINALRIQHIKDVTPLKNELNEKRAHLRTLESADKPDMNAINKTIDEMSAIRAQIMKKAAAHRAEVASLLTDEQRVFFNTHRGKGFGGKHGNGMGMGKGMRNGNGAGKGMGSGMGSCGNM